MSGRLWIVSATMLAVTSTASMSFAQETPPSASTPYSYERPNRALLVTGASIFVTTYALTASFAAAGQRAADRDMFVPLAGPFMNLANRNCARGCTTDTRDTVLIATSGGVQLISVGLMVASVLFPEKVTVGHVAVGPVKMQIAPSAAAGGGGAIAVGTF